MVEEKKHTLERRYRPPIGVAKRQHPRCWTPTGADVHAPVPQGAARPPCLDRQRLALKHAIVRASGAMAAQDPLLAREWLALASAAAARTVRTAALLATSAASVKL